MVPREPGYAPGPQNAPARGAGAMAEAEPHPGAQEIGDDRE
jgi:hypothetical protein